MMSWFRRTPTEETRNERPPHADHVDRADEADIIRQVLYLAGFHPRRDKSGGRVQAGYRVDDTEPGPTFLVRHAGDTAEDRQRQERAYAQALANSGYVVEPVAKDSAGGLRVWPSGSDCRCQRSTRASR